MLSSAEKFLSLYRTYENFVRAKGMDPKDLESQASEPEASQLTMARQFRNFLSHVESPGYLVPSDKMLAFLESRVQALEMEGDVAKKHLKSMAASTCGPKETCAEAVAKMSKLRLTKIAVQDKAGVWFVADIWTLAGMACGSKTAKVSLAKPLREKVLFVAPATGIEKIPRDRVVLCSSDGTTEGKLLGTVIF